MPRENPKAKKRCLICNQVKSVLDFAPNRGWTSQQNCDLYCKQCARGVVHNNETFRKYLWENNRLYSGVQQEEPERSEAQGTGG